MSIHSEPNLSYDRQRTAIFTVIGLILAIATIGFLYFLFNPRVNASPVETSVGAIGANPKNFVGRNVVLPGKVGRVLNASAFTLLDPNVAVGPEVLVISKSPIPPVAARPSQPALMPGDPVSVAGQLRRFNKTDRVLDMDTSAVEYDSFNGAPVVYASVVTPPGASAVVVTPHAGPSIPREPIYTGKASARDPRAEVTVVRHDPRKFLNQRIQIVDAVVTEVDSDRGFWIKGNSPERLFVVLGPGLDAGPVEWMVVVKPGQIVSVNGVVSPLPDTATLQTKWKMTPESAAELAKEQVYLFADGIYLPQP